MRLYGEESADRPKVLGARSVLAALGLHAAVFLGLWLSAVLAAHSEEAVIPIDMSIVVNENLDGNDDEPPPLANPPPKPDPAPKPPEPPPEPPRAEEKVEAVEQIAEKPKPPKKKEAEKPREPEKPKKSAAELREERLKAMRKSASKPVKIVVKNRPTGTGRTERQTMSEAEIRKLLDKDVPPGKTTQLAASEEQRCISLIRAAFYEKWNRPPWNDTLKEMLLTVRFDRAGRVVGYRLTKSSGDARADATVNQAAALVHMVKDLSADFLAKNPSVTVRFKVTPQ